MSFGGLILTNNGRNKMAAAISEKSALQFTKIQLGDGNYNGSYSSKTELTHKVMEIPITCIRRRDNEVLIECDWNSRQAPEAFYLREIGIIGNGVLCYYDNSRSGDAEFVDPASEVIVKQKRFRIVLSLTDEVEVTTMIPSGLYAMAEEVEESLERKLDKTGDASDATVTFEQAPERENISTGAKLSVLFGRVAKWLSDLKTVAFTGRYADLSGTPEIPTVGNGKITIKQAGTVKGIFTTNQAGDKEIELTDNNTTYGAATQSANGLMSAADKKKLDGLNKSALIGNGTGFVRPNHIGGSTDANDYVTEWHGFVYNMSNLPESYGFLDVTWFDGAGFSPSPPDKGGVVRQVFTSYNTGSAYIRVRINNSWTSWDSLSAKQEKALNDKFSNYLPLAGGTIKGTLKVRNPSYPNAGVDVRVDSEGANITLYTKTANKHYEIDTLNDRLRIYQHVNGAITTPAEVDADSKFNINGRAETAVSLTPRTIVTFTMSSGVITTDVGWLNNYLSVGPVYLMVVDTKTQYGKSFYTLRFTSANSPYFNVNLLNGADVVKMSFVGTGYRYEKLSSGPTSSEYEVLFYKLFEI